jgi:hypothetical protein
LQAEVEPVTDLVVELADLVVEVKVQVHKEVLQIQGQETQAVVEDQVLLLPVLPHLMVVQVDQAKWL